MLKTKVKFIILILAFLLVLCVFNANIVNASYIENDDGTVFIENEAIEGLIPEISSNVINSNINIRLTIDFYKMYDVTKGNTDNVTNDGYVYESIYIEIPDNIDSVINQNTGENLEIITVNEKKYFKYEKKLFKKQITCLEDMSCDEGTINLEYKEGNAVKEQKQLQFLYTSINGIAAFITIVDNENNYIGGNQQHVEGGQDCSTTDISTAYDYSDAYYKLSLYEYAGDSININNLGTFTYIGTEQYDTHTEYVYKNKITDVSIFTQAQNLSYFFEILSKDDNKKVYHQINFNIVGDTRQTYTVNDESKNIGISLNAATDIGVSLNVNTINETDNTYIEMANIIADTKDYIWIGAYEIELIGGNYEGDLLITFDLGEENNGKKVHIWHQKQDGTVERFEQIVESGKVTIKVTELSPFLLAYEGQSTEQQIANGTGTNITAQQTIDETIEQGEKDETPKTGITNTPLFFVIALFSVMGIGTILFIKKHK